MFNLTSILFSIFEHLAEIDRMTIEFYLGLSRTTSRGLDKIPFICYLYPYTCHN